MKIGGVDIARIDSIACAMEGLQGPFSLSMLFDWLGWIVDQ